MDTKTKAILMMSPLILLFVGFIGYLFFLIVKLDGFPGLLRFIGTFVVSFIATNFFLRGLEKYINSR